MQRLSPIQQGKFGYAECFEAFVRGDANGQKHQTQHIVEALREHQAEPKGPLGHWVLLAVRGNT